jgi:uncharacterized delta-60 repeat protein
MIGLVPAGAEAAPGDLDASFGTGGKVTTDLGGSEDVQAGALQADGRVVVVGGRTDGPTGDSTDFLVARYTASGALDTSLSSDGWVTTDFLGGGDYAAAVAVQPDGKIVVAGSVSPPFEGEGEGEGGVGLARYNADGSLDTSFSGDGKAVVVDIGGGLGMGLVLQPDGRLVIAGYVPEGFTTKLALARLDPDGSLDTSFSGDGIEVSDVGDFYTPVALKRADDGKLVVLAFDENLADYSVLRYTTTGTLDPTFDGDGLRLDPVLIANDLVTLPGGKILLAGSASEHSTGSQTMHFTRLNADGSLDPTFSGDGRHQTALSDHVVARSLALQPDGKLLVGGSYGEAVHLANWPMFDAAVFRFNPTGTLDPTFSGNGEAVVDMGGLLDGFASVLLQGDKIVGVGPSFTENGADVDIAVARLHGGGPPPDTTPPDTTITSGPGATTTGPAATFQFVSSEASSSFACRVDGAAFTPCGSPHTTATLAAGEHTFDVRAIDPAGNTDPTPATYSFSVAASAPTSPPPAPPPAPPVGPSSPTSPAKPQVSRACTTARSAKARTTRRLAKAQKQLRRATRPAAKRRLRKVVKKRKAGLRKAKRSTRRACD